MSMVGVNHLFNVMKAKEEEEKKKNPEMLVLSSLYVCMFKVQVKKETFSIIRLGLNRFDEL